MRRTPLIVALVLAAGLLFSLWQIAIAGLLLAVVSRSFFTAISGAFLLDLLYGPLRDPFLFFPFTLGSLILILVWLVVGKNVRALSPFD